MKRQLEDNPGKNGRKLSKRRCKKLPQLPLDNGTCEEAQIAIRQSEELAGKEETKGKTWTPEEDNAILSEVGRLGTTNWKSISKQMNSLFKGKRRTPAECEQRWRQLTPLDIPWTPHEELVLFLALYKTPGDLSSISAIFPSGKNVRDHAVDLLMDAANKAKGGHFHNLGSATPLQVLQLMISMKLLLDGLKGVDSVPEILEVLQRAQLEETHCLDLLSVLGQSVSPNIRWDQRTLEDYLEVAIEKIENSIYAASPLVEGPDELMHVRQNPNPQPQPIMLPQDSQMQYFLVPVSYIGQGYYLLALCYTPQAAPPQL